MPAGELDAVEAVGEGVGSGLRREQRRRQDRPSEQAEGPTGHRPTPAFRRSVYDRAAMTRRILVAALWAFACSTSARPERAAPRTPPGRALACPDGAKLETLGPDQGGTIEFCALGEVLHGPAREWYPNGVQRTSDHWDHGKKTGQWLVFDESGKKREERSFRDGLQTGAEIEYFPDGRPRVLTCFLADVPHGPLAQWAPTGELLIRGQHDHGAKAGTWYIRHLPDGVTIRWTIENGVDDRPEQAPFPDASFDELAKSCG